MKVWFNIEVVILHDLMVVQDYGKLDICILGVILTEVQGVCNQILHKHLI